MIKINRAMAEFYMTAMSILKREYIKIIENIKTEETKRTYFIGVVRQIEKYEQDINSQLRRNRFHD